MTPSHLFPIRSMMSSTDKIVFFKWHIYHSRRQAFSIKISKYSWWVKVYLDATTLVDQEVDPASSRHRFRADDSVLPIRIVHLDSHRFRHGREQNKASRKREKCFCWKNMETEVLAFNLNLKSVENVCGLKSRWRSNGRFCMVIINVFLFCFWCGS